MSTVGTEVEPDQDQLARQDTERRAGLAKACRCEKTYDSCEEMLKDDSIEAVFIATDAPSHARLAIAALLLLRLVVEGLRNLRVNSLTQRVEAWHRNYLVGRKLVQARAAGRFPLVLRVIPTLL